MFSRIMWFILPFSYVSDLIDNHKRIHGNTPSTRALPAAAQRASADPSSIPGHSLGSRGRNDPSGSWKRKYSVRHKSPHTFAAHPFPSPSSCPHRDAGVITASAPAGGPPQRPSNVTRAATSATNLSLVSRHSEAESSSAFYGSQQTPESSRVLPPGSSGGKRTVAPAGAAGLATAPPPIAALPKLAKQPSGPSGHGHTSKFVWVKTQNVKGRVSVSTPAGRTPPKPAAESTVAPAAWKKSPGKKYKWVSSYAQAKASRKSIPSKLPLAQRALGAGDTLKTAKTAVTPPAKPRKEVATSSRSSHYSWKAVTAAGPAVPRRSSFYWTAEKRRVREGFSPPALPCPPPSCCSPGPFRLHSRTKIIRRSATSPTHQ